MSSKIARIQHLPQHTNMSGAHTDVRLIELWLDGKAARTRDSYTRDIRLLFEFTGATIRTLTLDDLISFKRSQQETLAPSSVGRRLAAVKSLLSFAQRTGYHTHNVGAALTVPPRRAFTVKRMLTREEVAQLISVAQHESCPSVAARNVLLIRTLYGLGLRASELAALRWSDLRAGQCVVERGKGDKTRSVHVHPKLWRQLMNYRDPSDENCDPVFRSTRPSADGSWHLSGVLVTRMVKQMARAAGLGSNISAHWLRHAHATHAIEAGAPLHELQATLGHASIATTSIYLRAQGSFIERLPRPMTPPTI